MSSRSGDPPRQPRRPRMPPAPGQPPAQAGASGPADAPRQPRRDPSPQGPPDYTLYRAGRRGLSLRRRPREEAAAGAAALGAEDRPGRVRPGWRDRVTPRRAILGLLAFIVGWLLLSVVLFLFSATFNQSSPKGDVSAVLDGGGFPLTSATNILVLGSDQRTKKTHEPGASTSGPSRSDVMMLIRTGAGHSSRLSIPRDTVVDVPGHGFYKINAAYAFGGAALAIKTVKQFLGIPINHVVEVNFDNFPNLIDAMGGVTVKTGCVVSLINGGVQNGGYTLRLPGGSSHLNGAQALALARTRHNQCRPNESDLTRARRQQALFQAMKSRLTSPSVFFRLPWVAWDAPQALRSDMGGFTLLSLFASLAVNGTAPTRLLTPTGQTTLPDGEVGLTVSQSAKRAAVAQFMKG